MTHERVVSRRMIRRCHVTIPMPADPEAKGSFSNDANSSSTVLPTLELFELGGDVLADDVGPEAQHLAELDPRRAQLRERVPEPLAFRQIRDVGIDDLLAHLAQHRRVEQPRPALRPLGQAVAGKDPSRVR